MVSVCLLMCATAGIPTAAAQDCNALILDNAGALSSGIEQVEATARQLENRGAYVRVRTTTNFGGFQDMDSYEATLEASCPTWQDASGGTKANLIVLAVSFGDKRGAGLYYGDLWKSELEREWNPLLVDKVVPCFEAATTPGRSRERSRASAASLMRKRQRAAQPALWWCGNQRISPDSGA